MHGARLGGTSSSKPRTSRRCQLNRRSDRASITGPSVKGSIWLIIYQVIAGLLHCATRRGQLGLVNQQSVVSGAVIVVALSNLTVVAATDWPPLTLNTALRTAISALNRAAGLIGG